MNIWIDLATREGVFLVVLFALGAGPASFLSARIDSVVRLALTPALGMCVGASLTVTLVQWAPVDHTYWVLPLAAALSLAVAIWRVVRGRLAISLPKREVAQILVVLVAVLAPASTLLHQRNTVGPVAWNVYDAVGYVSEIDGQQTQPIDVATTLRPPWRNSTNAYWDVYASGVQNIDVSALEGSVNDLLGLGATDTQSPFLIAILLVGGLGAFAAVRHATESRSWAAVLAGALFGGAFFLQLWADSSEAGICGLALLIPFLVVGAEALRGRVADCVILALIGAGYLTVYPLFVPMIVLGSATVLGVLGIVRLRRGRPARREVLGAAWRLALVLGLTAAFTPVAFARALSYWRTVLNSLSGLPVSGLPKYHLPISVLPGWLLQTHEFYLLGNGPGGAVSFALTVLAPLVVIAVGFGWFPRAFVGLAFAAACALLAEYVWVKQSCSYCVQRNLLPIAPLAAVMLGLGVAALWSIRHPLARLGAALAVVLIVVTVGGRVLDERRAIAGTAYFLASSDRTTLAHLPQRDAVVEVEGFNENVRAPGELPLVVALVNERTGGHASVVLDAPDYSANAYIGPPDQPSLTNPAYRFVLTRLAGVATDRRTLSRSGGISLQQRTSSLDVTPAGGLGVPMTYLNHSGRAWVQAPLLGEPLSFKLIGGSTAAPAWVHISLVTSEPIAFPRQPGVTVRQIGPQVGICIRATGDAPVRTADVTMSFAAIYPPPLHQKYQVAAPAEGVRLASMSAVTGHCRP